MSNRRDQLVLGFAFAAAVLLHAAALPFVGAAVGRQASSVHIDLSVTLLKAPEVANAGDTVPVHVYIEQANEVSTSEGKLSRRDVLWLSRDSQWDEADRLLADIGVTNPLGKDAVSDNFDIDIDLFDDSDGPYWLIYQLDVDYQVPDRNRANNTLATPIYIDGTYHPELMLEHFDAPQRGTPGGSILIDFAVRNIGKGWAHGGITGDQLGPAGWADRVYLSRNERLDESDLLLRSFERHAPLGPDDSYRHDRVELELPRDATGRLYLIAMADADQRLDQPSFSAGMVVRPIDLIETGQPDLIVASIQEPERMVIGRPSSLTYSVMNVGSSPTLGSAWVDVVYLSHTPELGADAIELAVAPADQPLQPRSRYDATATLTLPESVEPGPWFLVVKADAREAIDEAEFEDNNTFAVPVTVLTQAQADAEIQLGAPDHPERLVVQWIEHDRVEEHRAQLSRTVQPALQAKAQLTPDAPLEFDPTPPAVVSKESLAAGDPLSPGQPGDPSQKNQARPRPTPTDASATDLAPRPQQPFSPTQQKVDGFAGDNGSLPPKRPGIDLPLPPTKPAPSDPTPDQQDKPSPLPGQRPVDSPAPPTNPDTENPNPSQTPAPKPSETDSNNPDASPNKSPTDQPKPVKADQPSDKPADQPSEEDGSGDTQDKNKKPTTTPSPARPDTSKPEGEEAQPASPNKETKPTRVPKDDSEAPPTNNRLIEVALQEGRVLVGEGIKVTTKLPTVPGTGARRLSLPRNARVRVIFDKQGKVHEAKVIRSTTYPEWDAAIEASLYRWRAQGKAVEEANPYISIEWNYLINELFDDE